MPYGNSVRILLDARAHITDEETGIDEEFYLIAPCRTEWMYRSDSCIQQPGGEYRLAWSQRKDRALRFSTNRINPKPKPELELTGDRYTDLHFTLTPLQNPQHAKNNVALVAAAAGQLSETEDAEREDDEEGEGSGEDVEMDEADDEEEPERGGDGEPESKKSRKNGMHTSKTFCMMKSYHKILSMGLGRRRKHTWVLTIRSFEKIPLPLSVMPSRKFRLIL